MTYGEKLKAESDARRAKLNAILAKHGQGETFCWSEVGEGWLPIVDEALGKLRTAGYTGAIDQVKQKLRGLRIYLEGHAELRDGPFSDIVKEAEDKAWVTCEDCGQPRPDSGPGFGKGLCDTCISKLPVGFKPCWKEGQTKSNRLGHCRMHRKHEGECVFY